MTNTATPEQGQLVQVRSRQRVVNEVKPSSLPAAAMKPAFSVPRNLLTLSSVEDDGLGEELQVVREIEPGARVIEKVALPEPTGFDAPDKLDAVCWGAASTADLKNIDVGQGHTYRCGLDIESRVFHYPDRELSLPDTIVWLRQFARLAGGCIDGPPNPNTGALAQLLPNDTNHNTDRRLTEFQLGIGGCYATRSIPPQQGASNRKLSRDGRQQRIELLAALCGELDFEVPDTILHKWSQRIDWADAAWLRIGEAAEIHRKHFYANQGGEWTQGFGAGQTAVLWAVVQVDDGVSQ